MSIMMLRMGLSHPRGFSLIEVLVTMVILAFGLLGLAGLQTRTQVLEMEAYQRSQAILLTEDMAGRMSTNRANAASYVAAAPASSPAGFNDTQPSDCSALAVGTARDVCEWSNELKGATETSGAGNAGAMTDARGCIDLIAGSNPPVYRISVAWQGMTVLSAPSLPCGTTAAGATLYGNNDGYRRVFAVTLPVANLTLP